MTRDRSGLPFLIAHRGNAAEYPENTLAALQSAVELGLRHVEFDVQLTRDGVPVVLHDVASGDLAHVPVTEPGRFGDRFGDLRVPALADVMTILRQWRDVTGFVEVKRASLRRFGHDAVLERIVATTADHLQACVLISFDLPCVERLRSMTGARIGWVIERYDEATREQVQALSPDYVFADFECLPRAADATLWPGPWTWAIYEIRDLEAAQRCAQLGAHAIETMHVRAMLEAYARASGS
jgi:glycerophosphoryl diester phosphodiesterase